MGIAFFRQSLVLVSERSDAVVRGVPRGGVEGVLVL